MKKIVWVMRFNGLMVSQDPILPGVWANKRSGFVVRGSATDPQGKKREVLKTLPIAKDAEEALVWLHTWKEEVRKGTLHKASIPTLREYGLSLFQRKVDEGVVQAESGKERWMNDLSHIYLAPFSELPIDQIQPLALSQWKTTLKKSTYTREYKNRKGEVTKKVQGLFYEPVTINGWLSKLRVIFTQAAIDYEIRNPMAGVEDLPTEEKYTHEEPNSLTPEEAASFLAGFKEKYPQHFAFLFLGFVLGLRPSSLRPIRRRGPTPDLLLDEGILLVRRSNTRKGSVWENTKTKKHQRLSLPESVLAVLRDHIHDLDAKPVLGPCPSCTHATRSDCSTCNGKGSTETDLLFPSDVGGLRARSSLDGPIKTVCKELGIRKHITPRAMRRTFQDLSRAANVSGLVARSISGHSTEVMQSHYSTVSASEQRAAIDSNVIQLFKTKEKTA